MSNCTNSNSSALFVYPSTKLLGTLTAVFIFLSGCDFQEEADAKFGDQHFKTAVALVELHKIRYGAYPQTLKEIRYAGEWDTLGTNSVEYRRIGDGYELNIRRGWVGKPALSYPPDFWQGLGIVSSNVGGLPAGKTPEKPASNRNSR